MRKLTRNNIFPVLKKIRKHLHLEHWEHSYEFPEEQPEDRPNLLATNFTYYEGRSLLIRIYPKLFSLELEHQLRTLIHEHIHALMNPYIQVIDEFIEMCHVSDRRWMEMIENKLNEQLVDFLTSVLYDLLKEKL
jgi:hypothetical protein